MLSNWKFWTAFIIIIVFILWLLFGTGKYRNSKTNDPKTSDKIDNPDKPQSKLSETQQQYKSNTSYQGSQSSNFQNESCITSPSSQLYTPYDDNYIDTPMTQTTSHSQNYYEVYSDSDQSSTPIFQGKVSNTSSPMSNFSDMRTPFFRTAKVTPRFNNTPGTISTPFISQSSESSIPALILGPIHRNISQRDIKTSDIDTNTNTNTNINTNTNNSWSWPSETPLSTDHILKMQADISLEEALQNASSEKKVPAESRGEAICRKVIEEIYMKKFPSTRPDFLKNPETGYNLELDGYCEELQIAFEYNGVQHYVFPNFAHRSENDFMKQVRRDQYKIEACNSSGIYLISVPYNIPHNQIRDYIIYYLPENVQERNDTKLKEDNSKIHQVDICYSNSNNSSDGLIHL